MKDIEYGITLEFSGGAVITEVEASRGNWKWFSTSNGPIHN